MLQVENPELVGAKCLTVSTAYNFLITRSAVNVCAISNGFLLVSLVTNGVSLEEVCIPSLEMLNCWMTW